MRDDMTKVIVERPRINARWDNPKGRRQQTPHELQNKFEGIEKLKGGTKQLNENLAPLRRFIGKQVNRPWDKVFAEINEHIKPGNTVQEHVLQHIDDFIARHVERVPPTEKCPTGLRRKAGMRRSGRGSLANGDLYVDPKDGIIKRAKNRVFVPPKRQPKKLAIIENGRIYAQENGTWYTYELGRYTIEAYTYMPDPPVGAAKNTWHPHRTGQRIVLEDGTRLDALIDAVKGLVLANETLRLERLYHEKGLYGKPGTKRQVGAKDLKRLNLKNEAPDERS